MKKLPVFTSLANGKFTEQQMKQIRVKNKLSVDISEVFVSPAAAVLSVS
jgi:hypothetical protein